MRTISKAALSTLLAVTIAAGAPSALALAGTVDEAMGEDSVAAAQAPVAATEGQATEADLAPQGTIASGVWGTCKWEVDDAGVLTIHPGKGTDTPASTVYGRNFVSPWDDYREQITSVKASVEGGRKVVLPARSAGLFSLFANVKSMDLSGVDTSGVTDMSDVFTSCEKLGSLDISGWDTSKVTDMSRMFASCRELASLDVSGWDVSNVTNMRQMFVTCEKLPSLRLSGWDVSNVTNMSGVFDDCVSMTTFDISGWDTSKVTDLSEMFYCCTRANSLNLSSWNTSKVTNMRGVFHGCRALKKLDISGWDMSAVGSGGDELFEKGNPAIFIPIFDMEEFKVGAKCALKGDHAFPETSNENKSWWSVADGRWYTKDEILASRSGVADTYLKTKRDAPAPTPEPTHSPAKTFPDVAAGVWYAGVVSRAAELGLINGYKDGRFGPADNVTRGQVAVILWNMAGKPSPKGTPKAFPDVAAGKYYCDAVRWASSVGVVSGYSGGRFGPDDNVTREQLAAMLANYAGKVAGRDASGSAADFASMKDAASVSKWAQSSVGWCFKNKIISGTKDGRVNPQGNATRAEAAKMVVFLHDMLG